MLVVFLGGLATLLVIYFPIRLIFPLIFKSLRWATPAEVGKIVIFYSIYQTLFGAITVKNCYLFAFGKPVSAQLNMLVSWIFSLALLIGTNIAGDVSRIAYCLVAGHLAGLLIPNLDRMALTYRKGCFRSEEHTSELQSQSNLVCRLLLEKKKQNKLYGYSQNNTNTKEINNVITYTD